MMTPDEKRAAFPYLKPTTLMLYGVTGSGKDYQIAVIAKDLFKRSGGKVVNGAAVGGLRTRMYLWDNGDTATTQPLINLGIIDLVDLRNVPHMFRAAQETAMGRMPEYSGQLTKKLHEKGKWVEGPNSDIGCFVFNGLTSISEGDFRDLRDADARGENVGGGGSMSFMVGSLDDGWGQEKMGSSNLAHYQVWNTNLRVLSDLWARLAMREHALVIVTAAEARTKGNLIGPMSQGEKCVERTPGLFNYTLHLTKESAKDKPIAFHLWLEQHSGIETAGATALVNPRWPHGTPPEFIQKQPKKLTPANLAEAIAILQSANVLATDAVAKELA